MIASIFFNGVPSSKLVLEISSRLNLRVNGQCTSLLEAGGDVAICYRLSFAFHFQPLLQLTVAHCQTYWSRPLSD